VPVITRRTARPTPTCPTCSDRLPPWRNRRPRTIIEDHITYPVVTQLPRPRSQRRCARRVLQLLFAGQCDVSTTPRPVLGAKPRSRVLSGMTGKLPARVSLSLGPTRRIGWGLNTWLIDKTESTPGRLAVEAGLVTCSTQLSGLAGVAEWLRSADFGQQYQVPLDAGQLLRSGLPINRWSSEFGRVTQ